MNQSKKLRIVHTADWHIGKYLHRQDLYQDFDLFLEWFSQYLINESIDVLLVSGDVFETSNPSNRDVHMYYSFLAKLIPAKITIIITGGNHDSISLLETSTPILSALNVYVIGGAKENLEEEIIPIYTHQSTLPSCIVLAVPFLRDKDLRKSQKADIVEDKYVTISHAIKNHYDSVVQLAQHKYGMEVPIVAMGHLFMIGSITSDSEREIHVGNLGGVNKDVFHSAISYSALGHIHKPQIISQSQNIRYSGSPIFLDFSESNYSKSFILLEIANNVIEDITTVPIPKNRSLIRWKGSLPQIEEKIRNFVNLDKLPAFIEITVIEDEFDLQTINRKNELISTLDSSQGVIIKDTIEFKNKKSRVDMLLHNEIKLEAASPLEIFKQKMEEVNINSNDKPLFEGLFMQIVDELSE